jgi:hypothetical protein
MYLNLYHIHYLHVITSLIIIVLPYDIHVHKIKLQILVDDDLFVMHKLGNHLSSIEMSNLKLD